jgi:Phosphodiester glycosidase
MMPSAMTVLVAVIMLVCGASAFAEAPTPATALPATTTARTTAPIQVERFSRPGSGAGVVAGIVARIDVTSPRIAVALALSAAPDIVLKKNESRTIDASCLATLATPSDFARTNNFDVTINASFFAAPKTIDVDGKKIRYFAGNCARPVGWHVSEALRMSEPANEKLTATLVMHNTGKMSVIADAKSLPGDTRWAVSGNAMVVKQGAVVSTAKDGAKHPRTAAGLSSDGKTLLLVVVDGRAPGHSDGVNMVELGELLLSLGAHDAINLDGGGSSAMVLKDTATGVFAVANRPSEIVTGTRDVPAERPVVDVIGVKLLPVATAPATKTSKD